MASRSCITTLLASVLLLLIACQRATPVKPPASSAYRFTRADEVQCIMKFPNGAVSLYDLKKECGCLTQICLVEVIRVQQAALPPIK